MDKTIITNAKPLLLSKTFWGVVIMLLAAVFPKAKLVNTDDIVLTVNSGFEFIGAALALYGRITADVPIGGIVGSKPVVTGSMEAGSIAASDLKAVPGIAATIGSTRFTDGAVENIADVPLVAQDAIAEQAENIAAPEQFQGILSAVSQPKAEQKPSMKTFFILASAASALDTVITVLSVGGGTKRAGLLKVLRAASAGLRDYMANPD